MENIKLDFEQARAKHLLFKSKLRSILFGLETEEASVLSHFECAVGKWIYGHALKTYGNIPEMHQLEQVHADIHTSARELVFLYQSGEVETARNGLRNMENIADNLVLLLTEIEKKVVENPNQLEMDSKHVINFDEFDQLLKSNVELDKKIKQQVEATAIMEERYYLIAKATQDAVWDWNLETNELWWNDGFKEMFGYKSVESGIESWYNRLHPDDKERVLKAIHDVIDNGGSKWEDEYRFLKADGSYAYVYDRGYAIQKNGKPRRMVGSMVDFSERKKTQDSLKRAYEDLELKVKFRNIELERTVKEYAEKISILEGKTKHLNS